MNKSADKIAITGMGILSPIGTGIALFSQALKRGDMNFSTIEIVHSDRQFDFPGAMLSDFEYKKEVDKLLPDGVLKKKAVHLRHLSTATAHGVYVALEACQAAGLDQAAANADRMALICGGSNFNQGQLVKTQQRYQKQLNFINPTHGFTFLDTDIIGLLSELLGFQGEGYSMGAASASGAMALISGYRLIASGDYDVVLVVAPSMELSIYEYQALTALGAMVSLAADSDISRQCAPFDRSHRGFVYGQNAAALVLESESHALQRGTTIRGRMAGYGTALDGNRNPNPSVNGETRAIQKALEMSDFPATTIEYINTHGTGAVLGDEVEAEAIVTTGMAGTKANATKSLIGHGITSAGLVEAVACLVQLEEGFLHPNPHLQDPITSALDWIGMEAVEIPIHRAISNSFGFGGINTSVAFEKTKNQGQAQDSMT
ncbi:MAG: beta-ketoacyl synthase N-terminal-like domain-containing protein [Bacteroidota bacterium]